MRIKSLLYAALACAAIALTGCTTMMEGTDRKVTVVANTPNVNATLETRSKKVTKVLPATFDLSTRRDRGDMRLTATDANGRSQTTTLHWVNEHSAKMYGGAAIGTAVFGVFGPISLATDAYNRANKDVSDSMITFDFLSSQPSVGYTPYPVGQQSTPSPAQPTSASQAQPAGDTPCPPMRPRGQHSGAFVWGSPDVK